MKGGEFSETARDWANVPGDVLRQIAERFESIEDYVRFGAVCRWWRHSLTTSSLNNNKPKFLPWLMLAEKKDSDMRGFYNLFSGKVFEIELPEIRGRRFWGSPFGWLITHERDLQIHLFNPLSRARLPLPPRRTFTHQYTQSLSPEILRNVVFHKIQISSNPTSSDFIAMAIYSQFFKLAFAKPGDDAWRPIECDYRLVDIIYSNGNFFALGVRGDLLICQDLYCDHPVAVKFAAPPPVPRVYKHYLVDLGGDLCMVCRSFVPIEITYDDAAEEVNEFFIQNKKEVTVSIEKDDFEIYKLDMHTRIWERVSSMGDWCLFLGNKSNNYNFSIRASHLSNCRSSCIYFTDSYDEYLHDTIGFDMGIFNYENKKIDYFPVLPDTKSLFSPPIFFIPCLQ